MSASAKARTFLASASPGTNRKDVSKHFKCSVSSLYYKERQQPKDDELRDRIIPIMRDNPAYGYRRVADALGMTKQKNRVARVMRRFRLQPQVQRKKKKRPRNTGPKPPPVPNYMERICPIVPNYMWAGDFTEFFISRRRKIYLATVIDTCTREIVGWNIGRHHSAALVIEALEDAFRKRGVAPAIFHSDQGSEYTSHECRFWLVNHGVVQSLSPPAKPWKNGGKESFYSHFKLELGDMKRIAFIPDFYEAISRQIYYYNNVRIHSRLHMAPHAFFLKHQHRGKRGTPWSATDLPWNRPESG